MITPIFRSFPHSMRLYGQSSEKARSFASREHRHAAGDGDGSGDEVPPSQPVVEERLLFDGSHDVFLSGESYSLMRSILTQQLASNLSP